MTNINKVVTSISVPIARRDYYAADRKDGSLCNFGQRLELGRMSVGFVATPPLSFPQSLVPAPVPQIESGSESSPFSDLP